MVAVAGLTNMKALSTYHAGKGPDVPALDDRPALRILAPSGDD